MLNFLINKKMRVSDNLGVVKYIDGEIVDI